MNAVSFAFAIAILLVNLILDDTRAEGPGDPKCFRAAVYQHQRREAPSCTESAQLNLKVYEKVTKVASQNGAKIIVFPEDGLFVGPKSYIMPCLHEIPDPDASHEAINPCLHSGGGRDHGGPLLEKLSCIARENRIYLVANLGSKEIKFNATEYLLLNTDVVFDSMGNLIKRYRKYNPFIEVFEKAPKLELAYFDTDFGGRFGVFTCFDILFRSPPMDLIEKHHINTALFPTWWFDSLPIHSAIQYQDAWSWGNRVNLLAANLLVPERGSIGCGIYSASSGTLYTGSDHLKPRLLLANLGSNREAAHFCSGNGANDENFNGTIIDVGHDHDRQVKAYKPYANYKLDNQDLLVALEYEKLEFSTCLGEACCYIKYKINMGRTKASDIKRLVLVVRDNRETRFKWWEQTCLLATLVKPFDDRSHHNEAKFDLKARVWFDELEMGANFTTKYVVPFANSRVSQLIDRNDREFDCSVNNVANNGNTTTTTTTTTTTSCRQKLIIVGSTGGDELGASSARGSRLVNAFGFYARNFDKDAPR